MKKPAYYDMIDSVYMNSTARNLHRKTRVIPLNEEEEAELEALAKQGACKKFVPTKKKNDEDTGDKGGDVNTEDDLSEVPGVGAATLKKLNAAGIITRSNLKDFALNKNAKLSKILDKIQAAKFKAFFDEEEKEESEEAADDGQPQSSREGDRDDGEDTDDDGEEDQTEE